MNEDAELNKQNILLHHAILSRVLPQDQVQFREDGHTLMNQMIENVESLEEWLPTKTIELFERLKRVNQERTDDVVSDEIARLSPGDTFVMMVTSQYSVIMIHVLPEANLHNQQEHNVIVATFPSSLHPRHIYEDNSDLEFNYPCDALKVKFSNMLRSKEFANQLCLLDDRSPIGEFEHKNHVNKWLLTILADEKSTSPSRQQFPVITKKIRDEAFGETMKQFFRRSGFYMSMKVILQHSLTMQLGGETGKFVYKIVMLNFLKSLCTFYRNPKRHTFDIDLLSQMIAKMARRIEKLSSMVPKSLAENIVEFYEITVRDVKETIDLIRVKIDQQISQIVTNDEKKALLSPLMRLNFEEDICYQMPKLREYLQERKESTERRYDPRPRVKINLDDPHKKHWIEFEDKILHQTSLKDELIAADEMRKNLKDYQEYAVKKYKENPVNTSRIFLVHLKVIAVLDRRVILEYPLYKKHRCGINSNIISALLLPQRADMETAIRLEQYFRMRNANASHSGLIEEKHISENSFSAEFAKNDAEMLSTRSAILNLDKLNVESKREEWTDGRKRVQQLRENAKRLGCSYRTDRYGDTHHDHRCQRCYLNRQANKVRLEEYERLLPNMSYQQLAVVFELQIPNLIACLRDILASFVKLCIGTSKALSIKANWIECEGIQEFNESKNQFVSLGSTTRRKLEFIHVDEIFERLIVGNSLNCVLHAFNEAIPTTLSDDAIKSVCTFKTQDEYLGLQWTLNATTHTENQVLSRQFECPQNLSLCEFKNFGSLRADGHRLQFRKLYGLIETEALSFDKQCVLSLVMQMLWELGGRDTHTDFSDSTFSSAMIQLLKNYVEQQEDNWMHPFKLLMATLIATRIFEINGDAGIANQIVNLLCKIRAIVWDWNEKIQEVIEKARNRHEHYRDLRLKLIYVAMTGCLTFFIYPMHKHYEKIFSIDTDLIKPHRSWLFFIILLRNNLMMYEKDEDKLPCFVQIFLRLIEICGHNVKSKITELIEKDPHELFQVANHYWYRLVYETSKTIQFDSDICLIEAEIDNNERVVVSIDIVTGLFLVDGEVLSQLPLEIIQNETYQRVFGNAVLEVQPNGRQHYSTVYNGSQYEFRKVNQRFIITERHESIERELIHYEIFWYEFPFLLSYNYSHWWNKQSDCIEFRQRRKEQFSSAEAKIDYQLDLSTGYLTEMKTKRKMLDVTSDSFEEIVGHLERLEHKRYIHVLLDNSFVASVELVRMKLKFKIDCSKDDMGQVAQMESNEFSGMYVSKRQKIDTLYGLNSGLILENSLDDSKILLMPHGDIHIVKDRDLPHVFARINTKQIDIKNPPFYQYQVDEVCKQLKASNSTHSSWFYLAYLHAITSHGQIEGFTGMSGTERALEILQSAFAWSSSPYDPTAIEMLKKIAELSPIREMIFFNQFVTFPDKVPSHSAQDSFVFIVKRLLEDSQRLILLHTKADLVELNIDTDLSLNERAYYRSIDYQPNLRVSQSFIEYKQLVTSLPFLSSSTFSFSKSTQIVAILYHNRKFKVPGGLNLINFLTSRPEVKGSLNQKCISNILIHNMYDEFPDLWIRLYDAIRNKEVNDEEIALILSFYAHQNHEFEAAILALQAVASNPHAFDEIDPPDIETFQIEYGTYDSERMSNVLKSLLGQSTSESSVLSELINSFVDELIVKINKNWPCDSVYLMEDNALNRIAGSDESMARYLNNAVNEQLKIWNNNRQLYEFIENVESCLRSLRKSDVRIDLPQYFPFSDIEAQNLPKYEIDFDEKIHEHFHTLNDSIVEAKAVWIGEQKSSRSAKDWWMLIDKTWNSHEKKHLIQTGLLPRLTPSLLLSKTLDTDDDRNLKYLAGTWAVTTAHEQREKRIKMYLRRHELQATINREIENELHANWKPHKRPEWLIFQVEQNVTIRKIQIKVAEQMIAPPMRDGIDARHSVMQLNMGEGKTAVIVPILAAVLADSTQVCQITVLKSMLSRNLKSLRQYLGGLLNRRIYIFPCRRNLPVGQYIKQIQELYEECKAAKGVILTLPEYRLSMELKVYDSIGKGDFNLAKHFLDAYRWQNENVRNILDESDAILQANYQLIYTIGNQLEPDGGPQRWTVIQAVLKRIPHHMKEMYKTYRKDKIEFDDKYIQNGRFFGAPKVNYRSDVFTPCRLLDNEMFEKLKTALANDFLNGLMDIDFPEISDAMKEMLTTVLTHKSIDRRPSNIIENFEPNEQNTILIISGLLRFEVIKLVLTKRWRVNYGVDVKSQRRMAIPFKAKDVAEESTEFGHPDVAICFTQISYYYSGLTDIQLRQLFELLATKQNATSTYSKWIQSISPKLITRPIRSYTGINIDDTNQRSLLFQLLRFNMYVIDFWLEHFVYPYEAKIFEQKLMCTTWDLCSDQLKHCVTGFSGTNDTKNNLPKPIAQNDLAELESTNENVRQILLQPENQSYESLPVNVSGMDILRRLTERRIPILLDSGALMLELTNEQVAIQWLEKTSDIDYDAAVYFDSCDSLQTIDRNGIVTEFDFSVYRENLNRCLVYLDDVHTRGTDLKFPPNSKACVTLSGDIPRDKTVQSCMRMRQLGTNHQICFWASCEADIGIRKICNLSPEDVIKNENVIEFISHNSRQMETKNMVHWTAAALNYTKKTIGHKSIDETADRDALETLFENCVDEEFLKLNEMFGDKEETLLIDIAWAKFDKIASQFRRRSQNETKIFVRDIQDSVDETLGKLAPNVKQFSSSLDEEQEKELEQEIEQQRVLERPPAVKPAKPVFEKSLLKLVQEGATDKTIEIMKSQRVLFTIASSLQQTQLFRRYHKKNKDAWSNRILVTYDFKTVIDSTSESCDTFLRPVWFVARIKGKDDCKDILLLLSTHECNCLFAAFQKSLKSTLFMYRPRLNKQHSILLHEPRLQIPKTDEPEAIDVHDEVQIGVYAGLMYFKTDDEQNAYCGFLGHIPRPRTEQQEEVFKRLLSENAVNKAKGFLPPEKRHCSEAISSCVGQCKFHDNPADLAIKLIESHHQTLLKDSHVASILERSTKLVIENNNDNEHVSRNGV